MIRNMVTMNPLSIEPVPEQFNVVFPDNQAFGVLEGGPSKNVADGFYILTESLPKSNHTVHHKSSLLCLDPDCTEPNFGQDISNDIIAK